MVLAERLALNLTALGFVALGAATAWAWYRYRGQAQGRLAAALVCLAIVAALGRVQDLFGLKGGIVTVIGIIDILAFMACGYFVLMFRDAFLPLSRRARQVAAAALAVSCALGVADLTVLSRSGREVTAAAGAELILTWVVFTGEPIIRFWLASRSVPSVQKARMRALSFGFAGLIAILVFDVFGGGAVQSPTAIIATQLIALAMVPVIYVSFAPPALLRNLWRMGEQAELRAAIQDLLIFSPTRQELAEKAAGWARRLLGAQGSFIVDSQGAIVTSAGVDSSEVIEIIAARTGSPAGGIEAPLHGRGAAIVMPLHLTEGTGFLGVTAGPFTPLFGSDEVNQLQGYASSVTAGLERVRVTERLAAIENNKTQFLNLASHELRGPLTVVRGYVSMLEDGLLGNLNERGRKAVPVITAKVLEMNALIEQMIEAARLEDGALMLRPEEGDLREIVKDAVDAVAPLNDDRHPIRLKCPERPVVVNADPDRIKTIVSNLVGNAVKYSPDGGSIQVEIVNRGGIARVSVKDRGVGIAKEHLPILFTRFGRVSTPETDHLPGTGLGLYLGRQLARLHGGEITVDSDPGRGSTFTLHLPVVAPPDPRSRQERLHSAANRSI
ncbi:MAG TPA: HAMP domain-containing sensor histidine kinase [Candidatus Acidoferrum sp.]|nr:HAMP domain-containing sensor histidine kinase [Candidatus Acidoferrum sp.]